MRKGMRGEKMVYKDKWDVGQGEMVREQTKYRQLLFWSQTLRLQLVMG